MRKPDHAFYRVMLERFGLDARHTLFIDDNLRNIHAAKALGMQVIHFTSPEALAKELMQQEILER